jgi:transcriptional regulator with XRE-family HTH domain
MKQFKDILKEKRKALHLSQRELSEATGIDRKMISRYETGDNFPGMFTLIDLAKCLNCSIDELCGVK